MGCIDKDCHGHGPRVICCVGERGPAGVADTITVGTTTTTEAGSLARVTDTVVGNNHTLDFFIPRGEDGQSLFGSSFVSETAASNYVADTPYMYTTTVNGVTDLIKLGGDKVPLILNGTDTVKYQYLIILDTKLSSSTGEGAPIFNINIKDTNNNILMSDSVTGIVSSTAGTYLFKEFMMVPGDILGTKNSFLRVEVSSSTNAVLDYTNMYIIPIAEGPWT